jgi:hypothetical protein
MKICPVGAELFHADGRTDITKLIVAFRNFANAPKNNSVNAVYREITAVLGSIQNTYLHCVGRA